jgi:hypothetical protein
MIVREPVISRLPTNIFILCGQIAGGALGHPVKIDA